MQCGFRGSLLLPKATTTTLINTVITQRPTASDEAAFFQAVGSRIARLRKNADLTRVQLASYEIGRRRLSVSQLPGIARALGVTIEDIIIEGEPGPPADKRGPASRL